MTRDLPFVQVVPDTTFHVLGPLIVTRVARRVNAGPRQQQAVLAMLLMRLNSPVSMDALIDGLWDAAPPSARNVAQTYVTRLRRVLRPMVLTLGAGGYTLHGDPSAVDANRFEDCIRQARQLSAVNRRQEAGHLLRSALALWAGVPFDGLPGRVVAAERDRLTDLWMTAIEDCVETDLMLGTSIDWAAELGLLTAAHPHRERLHGLHMLVLCAAGRRAEALAVFRRVRRHLVDEYGIEPGSELQDVHRRVLTER